MFSEKTLFFIILVLIFVMFESYTFCADKIADVI
jgi:hypothetical protein